MRSLRVLVLAMLAVFGVAASSYAAFSSVSRSTITASVQFEGSGMVWVSAQFSSGNSIGWNISQITPGQTGWKLAQNYIVLYSTITNATGGIQIYTNNRATDANPRYPTQGTANPAGLVASDSTTVPLPMCWRVTDSTTTTTNIVQGTNNRLYSSDLGGQSSDYACFLWMKDFNTVADTTTATTAFSNGDDYITVKDSARGMHHAEGTNWSPTASPDYLYFGANFIGAVTPKTYGATIRIETFTE